MAIVDNLLKLGVGYGRQALSRVIPSSKERVLRNLMANADELFSPARAEGATFDPRLGRFLEVSKQQGQMMSPVPNPIDGSNVARNIDDLLRIAQQPQNMNILRRGGYLGSWNSPERGGLVVDPSRRFLTKTGALRQGVKSEQDAGFNLLAGDVYPASQAAYNQARNRALGVAGTLGGAAVAAEAARGEDSQVQNFLTGLLGRSQEGKVGIAEGIGAAANAAARDPLTLASVLPFGIAARPIRQLKGALGKTGSVGREFSSAKGNIVGNLFTDAGTPIAPVNASKLLAEAKDLASRTGMTLEEALLANPGNLTNAELGVLGSVKTPDFLTDPNAPVDPLRLFQNPANPSATSSSRAGGVVRAAVTRNVKGQEFLTTPSKKELDLGKGVRFNEYPAAEYAKISPGELPSYIDKKINTRGNFGMILDDLAHFETKTRDAIPVAQLKDPERRAILKARAVENLVRVALASNNRLRIAALYWYPRAGEIARRYDNPKQMADVMAAMSPSMPWAANIDGAVGLKTLHEQGLLDDIIQSVRKYEVAVAAKTLKGTAKSTAEKQILSVLQERLQLLPDIHPSTNLLNSNNAIKALRILDNPSRGDKILGELKTRNFSSNIMDQVSSPGTTIDIHATDALTGVKFPGIARGMTSKERYNFGMEVMKEAADALGIPPAALQAIDWVTWKALFREAK